ncbi:TPA: ORF6C domain-containing protein [Enterococcus faecium]|nr:ORF6C domain-containing protein [Enterococcus faecium]
MQELVILKNKEAVTTSLQVAESFEKKHQHVLRDIDALKKDVSMLKDTMRISGQQEFEIKQKGNMKVMGVLGGKESRAYEEISKKVFSKFWSEFKRTFSIPRYGELPRKRFDDAVSFIEMWLPETAIRMEIDQLNRQQRLFGDDNE